MHTLLDLRVDVCVCTASALWFRRPPREREIRVRFPLGQEDLSGSSHTSDLKIGTQVAIPCQAPIVL